MAAKWSPAKGAVPSSQECCPERPGAVKGAPLLGAAKRTLDGEDRSEMITEEGKAGRKIGERGSAILVSSPAASNNHAPLSDEFAGNIGGDRRFTHSALLLDHGDHCHGCLLC